MKAIFTKYFGAGNFKGSRIKASDLDGNSITLPYPLQPSTVYESHERVALALVDKMKWGPVKLRGGSTKHGYVFVMEDLNSRYEDALKTGCPVCLSKFYTNPCNFYTARIAPARGESGK